MKRKAKKRQKLFTKHFANAVDVIVRGVRSGLPVNECLNIIARETPEPVCSEFEQLVEGIKVGRPLEEVMERGLRRIPTMEYRFFAIVLAIQQQTGSNLAETLSGLSSVLRERKKMADTVKTITSEARTTAMIIGSLSLLHGGHHDADQLRVHCPALAGRVGNVHDCGGRGVDCDGHSYHVEDDLL